jgi:hypothetical protein
VANKYIENYVKTSEAAYEKQKEIKQPKTAENNINRQEIAGKKPDSSTGFSCSIIAYSQSMYLCLLKQRLESTHTLLTRKQTCVILKQK